MGVDLGGVEIGVVQDFLYGVEVCIFVEEVCCCGMVQCVWVDGFGVDDWCEYLCDQVVDCVWFDLVVVVVEDYCWSECLCLCYEGRVILVEVGVECVLSWCVVWYDVFF